MGLGRTDLDLADLHLADRSVLAAWNRPFRNIDGDEPPPAEGMEPPRTSPTARSSAWATPPTRTRAATAAGLEVADLPRRTRSGGPGQARPDTEGLQRAPSTTIRLTRLCAGFARAPRAGALDRIPRFRFFQSWPGAGSLSGARSWWSYTCRRVGGPDTTARLRALSTWSRRVALAFWRGCDRLTLLFRRSGAARGQALSSGPPAPYA